MFKLEIEASNAAFGENDSERGDETARILAWIAARLRDGHVSGNVTDANGNAVGSYAFTARGE